MSFEFGTLLDDPIEKVKFAFLMKTFSYDFFWDLPQTAFLILPLFRPFEHRFVNIRSEYGNMNLRPGFLEFLFPQYGEAVRLLSACAADGPDLQFFSIFSEETGENVLTEGVKNFLVSEKP